MKANKILLYRKYARVVALFAKKTGLDSERALDYFYHSAEYQLLREGIGDIHCMSDDYLVEDLYEEWQGRGRYEPQNQEI